LPGHYALADTGFTAVRRRKPGWNRFMILYMMLIQGSPARFLAVRLLIRAVLRPRLGQ